MEKQLGFPGAKYASVTGGTLNFTKRGTLVTGETLLDKHSTT
jgi:hypothetical protein